jgi:sulfite reductase (ferredoxin)
LADAIYLVYAGFVNGAILLAETKTNHHAGIINLFDVVFVESNKITLILPLKIWSTKLTEPRGFRQNILRRQFFSKHRNVQSKRYR